MYAKVFFLSNNIPPIIRGSVAMIISDMQYIVNFIMYNIFIFIVCEPDIPCYMMLFGDLF